MNQLYTTQSAAMAAAYELAKASGKRVWRHQTENKYGALRWLVSFEEDAQNALQELTA